MFVLGWLHAFIVAQRNSKEGTAREIEQRSFSVSIGYWDLLFFSGIPHKFADKNRHMPVMEPLSVMYVFKHKPT